MCPIRSSRCASRLRSSGPAVSSWSLRLTSGLGSGGPSVLLVSARSPASPSALRSRHSPRDGCSSRPGPLRGTNVVVIGRLPLQPAVRTHGTAVLLRSHDAPRDALDSIRSSSWPTSCSVRRIACTWSPARPRREASGVTDRKRALVTGITGQDGSYLAELLLEKGYEVHGMVRRSSTETFQRLQGIRDDLTLHTGDLLDQRSLVDVLRECEPDEIYNLAAMSFVAASWSQPVLTAEFTGAGRHAHAGGDARGGTRSALLPGLLVRDVRQGARGAADRDDPVLPALSVRRGEVLRPLHHRQLPRVI